VTSTKSLGSIRRQTSGLHWKRRWLHHNNNENKYAAGGNTTPGTARLVISNLNGQMLAIGISLIPTLMYQHRDELLSGRRERSLNFLEICPKSEISRYGVEYGLRISPYILWCCSKGMPWQHEQKIDSKREHQKRSLGFLHSSYISGFDNTNNLFQE